LPAASRANGASCRISACKPLLPLWQLSI
jgi:hypothetical protein